MMELYLNATSPYARVVRIAALEKGLETAITLQWCDPWSDDPRLLAVNPAARVPALVTDEGHTLSESLLIVHHLDAVGPGPDLVPQAGRSETLQQTGWGQGLMEAAFQTVIARKHQGAAADESVLGQRRLRAIDRTLAALADHGMDQPGTNTVTLGGIVVAVALDYLLFRLPEVAWQDRHPALARWHDEMSNRSSFLRTRFP
ncbi:glutathione S-transferase family protein [Alkalilimnicola ehrlichii MLHE-1]|uniref:Glutathione S-transferase-like protein n=1 Tax=Alkalilimnicola ehrlichii (strain ATCC BAA-1101 / DSM 17681 / MLHE-1) TaxID=187272 RepID=Q0A7B0_ALKEH|nr:glutathione S-transferase N-terminal domain-containing protein [Alkalilimnicola ehrlichii]ABI57277.1 Glutathione S-transferase-like protein [Alkalilimnicola ehrlichii MLHE-1]